MRMLLVEDTEDLAIAIPKALHGAATPLIALALWPML